MSPAVRALSAAVALVALASLAMGSMSGARRESPRLPVARAAAPRARVAPPDARMILAHAAALELTLPQRRRLEALDAGWRMRERELLDAVEAVRRDMSDLQNSGRPVARGALDQRATGYSELSLELREARLEHAEDALDVLTATQALQLTDMTTGSRSGRAE